MNGWQRAAPRASANRKARLVVKIRDPPRPTELAIGGSTIAMTNRARRLVSETLIKMEGTSFAKGAMRACYRMKKMSQVSAAFFYKANWQECNNYVAKRYLVEGTERETYFSDIEMQMVSKRFARKYNALKPPKKVDFLQAFVIEVVRNGEPLLFCVERAIESGQYTKHNNNSGFVEIGDDEKGASDGLTAGDHYRATPNAFTPSPDASPAEYDCRHTGRRRCVHRSADPHDRRHGVRRRGERRRHGALLLHLAIRPALPLVGLARLFAQSRRGSASRSAIYRAAAPTMTISTIRPPASRRRRWSATRWRRRRAIRC